MTRIIFILITFGVLAGCTATKPPQPDESKRWQTNDIDSLTLIKKKIDDDAGRAIR